MPSVSPNILHVFARRWCLPILAELEKREGSKFVTLARELGATPAAVRQSLDHLIELELVQPNPGYGHPLRPEYILTTEGNRLGPSVLLLERAVNRLADKEVAFLRWSMPALAVVGGSPLSRFSEIGAALSPVTDRALAQTLKRMQAGQLVTRGIEDSYPPVPGYSLGRQGKLLIEPLMALADA
ncbi:MAG: winged helix-turn-helix transcriptional regulator [Phycisphaerales bacterium]